MSASPVPSSTTPEPSLEQTESSSSHPSHTSTLSAQLDGLLIRYLAFLDTYTTLRSQLSQEFSSGFISLAQANRTSHLGPGRRYGEEGYDGRMKSLWTVTIEPRHHENACRTASVGTENESRTSKHKTSPFPAPTSIPQESLTAPDHQGSAGLTATKANGQPKSDPHTPCGSPLKPASPLKPRTPTSAKPKHSLSQDTTHDAIGVSEHSPQASIDDDNMDHGCIIHPAAAIGSEATANKVTNPLNWYGIFTPPALRQTQSCFTTAVTSMIPELLDATRALQSLERQIRRLRDEIRASTSELVESRSTAGDDGNGTDSDQQESSEAKNGLRKQSSLVQDMSSLGLNGLAANSGNRLVATEPRSRLLRLE